MSSSPRPRPRHLHRPHPTTTHPVVHESLMGSLMARSTPPRLLHSPVTKICVTLLECIAAVYAISLFITLCALHIRFVRRDGCASHLISQQASVIELSLADKHFRFSRERGFLLLSDSSLTNLNVSVQKIRVPSTDTCLGDIISRAVLFRIVGYDTVAVNAFAKTRHEGEDGYVLAVNSRRLLNLVHADRAGGGRSRSFLTKLAIRAVWKCGAIMTALFIMITTAALVSFAVSEVQVRMLKLTMELRLVMRQQQGYGRAVVRNAFDALVFVPIVAGMLFFLFEFFDDQALAFAVLVITCLCEFAASGSTRHTISRVYLPRMFFCYFGAFHVYFFSFPLGFSWLAFTTSLLWMVHAALAVWNHCELPMLRSGVEGYVND